VSLFLKAKSENSCWFLLWIYKIKKYQSRDKKTIY
jgi:hypothetical protein